MGNIWIQWLQNNIVDMNVIVLSKTRIIVKISKNLENVWLVQWLMPSSCSHLQKPNLWRLWLTWKAYQGVMQVQCWHSGKCLCVCVLVQIPRMCAHSPFGWLSWGDECRHVRRSSQDLCVIWPDFNYCGIKLLCVSRQVNLGNTCAIWLCAVLGCWFCLLYPCCGLLLALDCRYVSGFLLDLMASFHMPYYDITNIHLVQHLKIIKYYSEVYQIDIIKIIAHL